MIRTTIAAAAFSLLLVTGAGAWNDLLNGVYGPKGNDTGGIIPWSPENERAAYDIAQANCGYYKKYAVPTSINRVPGDFISYRCVWDPPVQVRRVHRRIDVIIDK